MLYSELKKIIGFPCLSCPFIRILEDDKPICSVYSHQNVGLEACQEVATFIKENGTKKLIPETIVTFNKDDILGKV